MEFLMTHKFLSKNPGTRFTPETAPDWLTSRNTIPGSTMDGRWFWNDHVMTLPVGGTIETDFRKITRLN